MENCLLLSEAKAVLYDPSECICGASICSMCSELKLKIKEELALMHKERKTCSDKCHFCVEIACDITRTTKWKGYAVP